VDWLKFQYYLLQWELSGVYVEGISLESYDCRLQIGYVDDMIFTWYTFGGMNSWMGLLLSVGVISAVDFDNNRYI